MTGYKCAKIINEMLAARGLKQIPAQMVYNYIAAGYITGVKGRRQEVTVEQFEKWAENYVARRELKAALNNS